VQSTQGFMKFLSLFYEFKIFFYKYEFKYCFYMKKKGMEMEKKFPFYNRFIKPLWRSNFKRVRYIC